MHYTGVGSRDSPESILLLMREIGAALASAGLTLRSGGAEGADSAFETGCDRENGKKEIYLPFRRFNGNTSSLFGVTDQALKIASKIHPAWAKLSDGVKKLHARNVYQVLGHNLSAPAAFLICWTPDGLEGVKGRTRNSGGTATAVVLAETYGLPRFNLSKPDALYRLGQFLQKHDIALTLEIPGPPLIQSSLF